MSSKKPLIRFSRFALLIDLIDTGAGTSGDRHSKIADERKGI